mgnify:CR=1 FL=1
MTTVKYDKETECIMIYLPKEVDHHEVGDLKDKTEKILETEKVHYMVFDFSRTEFMDSSGIGAMMGRYKRIYRQGGEVLVCGLSDRIRRILKLSGIFRIVKEVEMVEG